MKIVCLVFLGLVTTASQFRRRQGGTTNPLFCLSRCRGQAHGCRQYICPFLYLGRYAALRIHECFQIDTSIAAKALKENALTIKGKGGLVRTVPLNDILLGRLKRHLEDTPRGHKLFVPDDRLTHEAIKDFQRFLADHRPLAQGPGLRPAYDLSRTAAYQGGGVVSRACPKRGKSLLGQERGGGDG